jgi:hypothetical protein
MRGWIEVADERTGHQLVRVDDIVWVGLNVTEPDHLTMIALRLDKEYVYTPTLYDDVVERIREALALA